MKCKNIRCDKPADSANQRWYCSRECAPYGHFGGESPSSSASRTKRFYMQTNAGEALIVSSGEIIGPASQEWSLIEKKDIEPISASSISRIKKNVELEPEKNGIKSQKPGVKNNPKKEQKMQTKTSNTNATEQGSVMPNTENQGCEESTKLNVQTTQPSVLSKSSLDIDGVRSESLSLIRTSGERLSALMKSEKLKPLEICACADQLHKLIRLNLDILRQLQN